MPENASARSRTRPRATSASAMCGRPTVAPSEVCATMSSQSRSKSREIRSAMSARAIHSGRADAVGHRAEVGVVGIDEIREDVDAAPLVARRQLHPRHEGHAEGCRGLGGLRPPRRRVVIGERRGAQTVPVRGGHDLRRRLRAVGVDRVQMQVARSFEATRPLHHPSVAPPPTGRSRRAGAARTDLPGC